MCQRIEIAVAPTGTFRVFPTECPDNGTTCRSLSAPYSALGTIVDDLDAGNSHVVTVDAVVTDLDAMADAAASLGLELVLGQTNYRWYGRSVGDYKGTDAVQKHGIAPDGRCSHAIRIPDNKPAYEIGLVANPAGDGYRLAWDNYCGGFGLTDRVSRNKSNKDMELLTQAYSVAAIRRTAVRQRQHVLSERAEADGTVRMTIRV